MAKRYRISRFFAAREKFASALPEKTPSGRTPCPLARARVLCFLSHGAPFARVAGRPASGRPPRLQLPGAAPLEHVPAPRQDRVEGALHRGTARPGLRPT